MDQYIGKKLDGRYEIRELIGVGGMAQVYKAYDCVDEHPVAVKILKEEYLTNADFIRRFRNESKAIAILSHPNIVRVYDVGASDSLQYIVMEYIDGITLKEYIDQQKVVDWKETVHFTVQILRALQHAHDKGIVHRDIKPQNMMLLSDGTIKVTDFGIAQFSRGEMDAQTLDESKAIGSVHYISPEQASGGMTDEKSDLYSVGVMMYEMLTGRLPFDGTSAVSVAIMQMQSAAQKPRTVNPEIPEGLEEIILKAMQKDPAKRYQSAAEMLYDIDEFKKNPSIHFAYTYLNNEEPTRYVDAITKVRGAAETKPDESEDEPKKAMPMLPVFAAIAVAFFVVALVVMGFIGVNMLGGWDALFGNGDSDTVIVEKFIGKNYLEEIYGNETYKQNYNIVVIDSYDETVAAGLVVDQEPKEGFQQKKGAKLTLTVSLGQKTVKVPEVTGYDQTEANARLVKAGFAVNQMPMTSDEIAVGKVVKTYPAEGTSLTPGSTVTMYVSTGPDVAETTEMPSVVGMNAQEAKTYLESLGFLVVETFTYENTPLYDQADVIISQKPLAKTPVQPLLTTVEFVVSTGYSDVEITLPLPDTSTEIDLKVYVDGVLNEEISEPLKHILPNKMKNVTFTLSQAREGDFKVTVMIAASGETRFAEYAEYTVNAKTGECRQDVLNEFDDPYTTTPPTTPPTEPEPSEPTETSSRPTTPVWPPVPSTDPTDPSTEPTDPVESSVEPTESSAETVSAEVGA